MSKKLILSLALSGLVLTAMAQTTVAPAIPRDEKIEQQIETLLKKMTLDEKVGQMCELKSFPYNIDGRMYTSMLDKNVIFQGDGLKKMPIIDLVNIERGVKNVSCLILSNTCDMDLSNSRMFPASIMYAPIINLTTYISVLQKQGVNKDQAARDIESVMLRISHK
jgi:hypothetical protein